MNVSFVLVEPAVPENIGAAARAINTMGFNELRLVNPANHLSDHARWLAHGSNDILEKALIFHEYHQAIADLDFLIGTTANTSRSAKYDFYPPEKALEVVTMKKKVVSKIGIVFGREESGLTNEELSHCDIASSIPLLRPHPSINLAQSVMIYAYIFSSLANDEIKPKLDSKNQRMYRELKSNAIQIFRHLDIQEDSVLFNRMMERLASANEDDTRLFLSFAKKFMLQFE